MEYFIRNQGVVLSSAAFEHVWDLNFEPSSNVVDLLATLNKIDKPYGTNHIKTIRGHGYLFDLTKLESK